LCVFLCGVRAGGCDRLDFSDARTRYDN
jgi:hypothetical protein